MNSENSERDAWWIRCHFVTSDGGRWSGVLLRQGRVEDLGAWVVVDDRSLAANALGEFGDYLWVAADDGDRLVPSRHLDFVTLEQVE